MSYSHATPDNAKYLASKTGLNYWVALAWLMNEGQSVNNPTNPLNIRKGGAPGQTGTSGGFAKYASPHAGLDAAAWLVNNSAHYTGIRAAIKTKDPLTEARAIERSPWAAGHYGGLKNPGGISKALAKLIDITLPPPAPGGGPPGGAGAGSSGDPGSTIGPNPDRDPGHSSDLCAWHSGTDAICFPQGHIITQTDADYIIAYLKSHNFFSGDDPMGTGQQVTTALVNKLVGSAWTPDLFAFIQSEYGVASASATIDPVTLVGNAIGGLGNTLVKIVTYVIAAAIIFVGIWLYSKGASRPGIAAEVPS